MKYKLKGMFNIRIPESHYTLTKKGFVKIYRLPITKYSTGIKLTWGLGWFYPKQLWAKNTAGNLPRNIWFIHLKLELITFILLPYILYHNLKYSNDINLNFRDYCPDED